MGFRYGPVLAFAFFGVGAAAGLFIGIGVMLLPNLAPRSLAPSAAPAAEQEHRPFMIASEVPPEVEDEVVESQPVDPPKPAIVNNPGAVMGPAGGGPRGGPAGVYFHGGGEFGSRRGKK